MTTKPTLLAYVFASVVLAHAQPELKGTADQLSQYLNGVSRTVALTGEGELKLPADRSLIFLKVVTENKSLQEASRANQEIRAKMLRTLTERGVSADRVQASKFSSTPKYGMFGEKAKSYRVENVVKISANDEKEFQAVAGLVDAWPEVRYDNIEFEHSNKEQLKRQVIEQAINKVTEKKQLYERLLDVKLMPKAFSEANVGAVTPLGGRPAYQAKGYSSKTAQRAVGDDFAVTVHALQELPTPFSELVYRAQVTVEYAVGSK